jgi:hypothetical protein
MIGGCLWRITKDSEDLIYAVDFNHRRERHLAGTVLELLTRPSILITGALNATYQQAKRKDRDAQLGELLLATLRRNGTLMIVADTAGRSDCGAAKGNPAGQRWAEQLVHAGSWNFCNCWSSCGPGVPPASACTRCGTSTGAPERSCNLPKP